jgi:hypothetical protein
MRRTIFALLTVPLIFLQSAAAVSLNGRTNDDSVCDLSPYTTSRLGQLTFVPARTANMEEIYTRLAMRFVVGACRQKQTLILHSDDGSQMEDRYFTGVATRLCGAANIVRQPVPTAEQPHAFRVKCPISQLKAAETWLRKAESSQSTEALIASGAPAHQSSDEAAGDKQTEDRQARCKGDLSYGALIGISGGCRE